MTYTSPGKPGDFSGSVLYMDDGRNTIGYSSGSYYTGNVRINSSRTTPTGAANIPRSWGSLACAYFGQPSVA